LIAYVVLAVGIQFLERAHLYHEAREWRETPIEPFEDILTSTPDGESINVWYIPQERALYVCLLCHGNGGNNSYRVNQIHLLHERGYAVAIFDYRGYGRSSGRPTEKGFYLDAQTAYDWLISAKKFTPDKIIVIGTSMGGSVAVDLASKNPVRALVVESSFTSKFGMAGVVMPFLPIRFFSYDQFDSIDKLPRIHVPILIAHGDADGVIPFAQGKRLFDSALPPKFFYTIAQAGHNDYLQVGGKKYLDTLQFFIEHLSL